MTTIIRPGWAGSFTCAPDLFASGPASFKNLRSREISSTPRSWVCGFLKKTRWPPTRNTNSSSPWGWTSPRCSTSSTASAQLRLCGSLPLTRFWYSDSRCLLMVRSPSQTILSSNNMHLEQPALSHGRRDQDNWTLVSTISRTQRPAPQSGWYWSGYESPGNTIVQLRGLFCCGRMKATPVRPYDENDELSSGHPPALYGARYSRHEQGVQPGKLR